MKRQLLSGIALTALLANSAIAADMAVKAPPPAPIANWTGGYVGVTAGAAWGSYDPRTTATNTGYFAGGNVPAVNAAGAQSINPVGFATGIEAGYNWQNGRLLFGVEGDIQAVHLNGAANSGGVTYPLNAGAQFVISSYANSDWLATGRARVGYVTD